MESKISECMENMVLHNGICRHSCPEGHYPSSYDNSYYNQSSSNLDVINNAIVCLQCHYSCRKCTGSLDNQCIECYSDATLYVESTTDQYCYPYHIMDKALSENWYHRVYIINILVIVIAVLYFIVKFIRKRTRNQRRQENLLRGERDYEFS